MYFFSLTVYLDVIGYNGYDRDSMLDVSSRNDYIIFSTKKQCFSTKAPKAQEKSYLFFSLFSLISSLEKSRGRFREK